MAKVNFVGLQNIDFEDRRTGNQIQGLKLHINYLDENVMGFKADSKFVSREACRNLGFTVENLSPLIGKEIELETNLKGSITGGNPLQNLLDFYDGDFVVTGTTLDDIYIALIIIIVMLGVIAGACIFRHLRK